MTYHIRSSVIEGRRRCTRCGETKPLGDFYEKPQRCIKPRFPDGSSRYMSECKVCFRARMKEYRDNVGSRPRQLVLDL